MNIFSKLRLLLAELKEEGWGYALKRVRLFLTRPLANLIKQNRFLVELGYRAFPQDLIKFPQTELVKGVRQFWYSNTPGTFNLDGEVITRKDIFLFGGPNPKFTCPTCQKSEWLSRLRQKNLFIPHSCEPSKEGEHNKECQTLCSRQGDELWTHLHQNFDFSIGCDQNLPAAQGLCLIHREKEGFLRPRLDIWELIFRRRLAYVCQIEVRGNPVGINWSDYNFLFVMNDGNIPKFPRPDIPIIMYGHDFWPPGDKGFQRGIDWFKPDIFLTADPTPWQKYFKMPPQTKVVFYPLFDSLFFARPNLEKKEFDLLVVGAMTSSAIYQPRLQLNKQIAQFPQRYKIKFLQTAGSDNVFREGSTWQKDVRTGEIIPLLNKWSESLGRAKYVIFGRLQYPSLTHKHFEVLGSGAVPILPEVPDLKYLGIQPFEHYIPLSEVEGNNERLVYFLDNYEKFRYLAKNAVAWYKKVSDKMLFNDFEDIISNVVGQKFPKRLI